jgi:hypothetical protein
VTDLEDVNFFPRSERLPEGFSNALGVAARAGVTPKQVYYWTGRGHLHPEDCGAGSGYQRAFSDDEVRIARKIGELIADGFRLDAAARKAREHIAVEMAKGPGERGPGT